MNKILLEGVIIINVGEIIVIIEERGEEWEEIIEVLGAQQIKNK